MRFCGVTDFFPVISLEEGFFKVDYSQFHGTFEVPTTPHSVKEQEESLLLSSPLTAPSLCHSAGGVTEGSGTLEGLELQSDAETGSINIATPMPTTKMPAKFQRLTGREAPIRDGMPRKLLRMSSEITYNLGDLPVKLQRISSAPGVAEERLQSSSAVLSPNEDRLATKLGLVGGAEPISQSWQICHRNCKGWLEGSGWVELESEDEWMVICLPNWEKWIRRGSRASV